jgi:hypothetical protein
MNKLQVIEQMRGDLIDLATRIGTFADDRVIALSQQLDLVLVEAQKQKICQSRKRRKIVV